MDEQIIKQILETSKEDIQPSEYFNDGNKNVEPKEHQVIRKHFSSINAFILNKVEKRINLAMDAQKQSEHNRKDV